MYVTEDESQGERTHGLKDEGVRWLQKRGYEVSRFIWLFCQCSKLFFCGVVDFKTSCATLPCLFFVLYDEVKRNN